MPRITVTEALGLDRPAWPITLGVPLPKGWLTDAGAIAVRSEHGVLPTQSRALAKWPDGSVRWALVDFQADLKAHQHHAFEVRRQAPAPARTSIRLVESEQAIDVDTGVLRFTVPKHRSGLIDAIAAHGRPLAVEPMRTWLESGGHRFSARAPETVTVEERGPLRATIAVRGHYENGFAYALQLEVFAGQSYLRVLHTFINATDPDYTMVDRLALELPLKLGTRARFSAAVSGAPAHTAPLSAAGVQLVQMDNLSWRQGATTHKGHLAGWFEAHGDGAAIAIDAPFFWQEYPQAMRLSPTGATYDLWSPAGGSAKVGAGAAKTHEVFLVIGDPKQRSPLPQQPARGVVAHVDPAWTVSSGALLNSLAPQANQKFVTDAVAAFERYTESLAVERWDDSGQVQCPPPPQERPRTGCYGMFNWGDWNFRGYHDTTKGCDAWGNHEYDLTQVLALLFAATGRADVHEYLVAAARHFTDVDRIHHQPRDPNWVGMNHPKNPLHFSFELGGVDLGHTWVEGLFSYYFLTGDERAHAGASAIADYLVLRTRAPLKGNPRQFGWPVLALAAAFDATGDGRYRDAAKTYAAKAIQAHPAGGALKDWKMSILADGLAYAHALTGDASIRAWLQTYAEIVIKERPKDIRYYPAVAYVSRIGGPDQAAAVARTAANRIVFGDWGKPFTIAARTGFRIHALLGNP